MEKQKQLVQLALDTYRNILPNNFSQREADNTLRKAFIQANGGKETIDYKSFRRNKIAIFEIMEEVLQDLISEGITNQFDGFAEVRNVAWGDTPSFTIPDPSLFQVATISDGNGNLRRQRLDTDKLTIVPETIGVKVYEEFYRFLVGRVSWVDMVNKVRRSIEADIANKIYGAIYDSYNDLAATYKATDTNSTLTDRTTFDNILAHTEASADGSNMVIYGTRTSLAKISPAEVSDSMRDIRNSLGYYGVYNGVEMREIKQAHKAGTDDFAINDAFVLIVPEIGGQKLIKVVNEGEAIIRETAPGGNNADMSSEYEFTMKVGVSALSPFNYGIYRFA
jgi:hypothetical protein